MILPSYHLVAYQEEIERSQRFDYSQLPYFVMAFALLGVFALTLLGTIPSYVLVIAWFIALSKCF